RNYYQQAALPQGDLRSTAVAQPAIATATVAGLKVLKNLGITATVAVGHSLGEICALHWGGAISEDELLTLTKLRGQAMKELGSDTGVMASIRASAKQVSSILPAKGVVIAGFNAPQQTIISGTMTIVTTVLEEAQIRGWPAYRLPISQGFHSPLISDVIMPLAKDLDTLPWQPLHKRIISTVTGSVLDSHTNLKNLLCQQITHPVRFQEALTKAATDLDLLIEVGPGHVLDRLASQFLDVPAIALDVGGSSLKGLLQAVGYAFTLGVPLNHQFLFSDRFARPFELNWQPKFLANPCEVANLARESVPAAKHSGTAAPQQCSTKAGIRI
ncbi:MAG: acyltransferase domain-containing protein, partial [Okeania sp. SIO2D1]|nr:acyltransferase domain-containing protein [Okeania sp. SIO2D1]